MFSRLQYILNYKNLPDKIMTWALSDINKSNILLRPIKKVVRSLIKTSNIAHVDFIISIEKDFERDFGLLTDESEKELNEIRDKMIEEINKSFDNLDKKV